MRIAFDIDGTLADLSALLTEAAERMFGPNGKPAPRGSDPVPASAAEALQAVDGAPDDEPVPPEVHELTAAQQRRLWTQALERENFWEALNETEPGIVGRLAVLALERRWEVIFLTQRPASAGDTTQMQTQRWLARLGFAFPSVFVINGSRGKVAQALDLDVVVDDRADNCLDVVLESKARAFLVWRGDPSSPAVTSAKRLNIQVVGTTGECLAMLAAEREDKSQTVLGRLKRFMGSS